MPELLQDVMQRAGFTVEYQLLSQGSLNLSAELGMGSWDACVIDVQNGIIDICPMYVYETSSRRSRAQFTIPFDQDNVFMMVPRPDFEIS